jgi:hypothetical protein
MSQGPMIVLFAECLAFKWVMHGLEQECACSAGCTPVELLPIEAEFKQLVLMRSSSSGKLFISTYRIDTKLLVSSAMPESTLMMSRHYDAYWNTVENLDSVRQWVVSEGPR